MPFTKSRSLLKVLFTLIVTTGCNTCDVGSTWCEDNEVMVCVADESEKVDMFAEEDESNTSDLVDFLLGDAHVEVLDACHESEQICEEMSTDDGDTYAACDWPLGTSWMYEASI